MWAMSMVRTSVLTVMSLSEMLLQIIAIGPWRDVAVRDTPFMALVYRIPNSDSPHETATMRDTPHHGAAIISPKYVFCVTSTFHPLPSKMVPEVTWPYLVVAGIVNASKSGFSSKTAQVRGIASTKVYEKSDKKVNIYYQWIVIEVNETFSFTEPEVSFIRILGIVLKYLHKDFWEPCQALHWQVRKGGTVHLVGAHFFAGGWQICETNETAQYMSMCIPGTAYWWICSADPREVFIICQNALAGVYERFSSHSQDCKAVQNATSLQDVKPVRFFTAWHDSGAISSMMCKSDELSSAEDYVRFNLVDITRYKENGARRRSYSLLLLLLLCAVVS